MLKITALNGNSQKLDGGAMFGNAPRALWSQWVTPDANNCIQLSCRCLLIQDNEKNILLETGIGAFFEPSLKDRYGVIEDSHILLSSLASLNLSHEEIDIVILSHLHFDHAGGLLSKWENHKEPELLFPNAHYLTSQQAWERACHPHPRDRVSFIPSLIKQLKASNRLELITSSRSSLLNDSRFYFHFSDGHTPGMLLTEIRMPNGPIIFAADLIPGTPWVRVPITMGYDRHPELLVDEKKHLLDYLYKEKGRLFYTHDPEVALSAIEKDEKGHYIATHRLAKFESLIC